MNIFISSAGGDLAQNVITCLRQVNGVHKIIGSDISIYNSGRVFVDESILGVRPDDIDYVEFLSINFKNFDIDFFMPMSQQEIKFFASLDESALHKLFEKVKYIGVDKFIVNTFLDKLQTSNWLNESGFVSPKSFNLQELRETDFPVIVKPRFGSGSKGVFKCLNIKETLAANTLVDDPIIQEYVDADDSEFTVGIYSNLIETKVISFRRKIAGSGATSWARHEVHQSIINLGESIAKKLNLLGSINVQLRVKDNKLFVFEINPRFSSTVLMRSELGFNDVAWSLGDFSTFRLFDSMKETGAEFATYVRPIRLE
jgi:carbamoyl-phosphate synthase large subunit